MRGTPRQTNRALSEPILVLGAERSLVIVFSFFFGWALMGVFPHWPFLLVIMLYVVILYVLRFVAKQDPQGVSTFRNNSRFLLQKRFYLARGNAGNIQAVRTIQTVPVNLISRI